MRKIIAGFTALAAAAAMLVGCGGGTAETPISVQSVAMLTGLGSVGVCDRFAGVVEAGESVKVNRDSKLELGEVLVKVGDTVKEGQPLFTYDTESLSLELEKMKLELEQMKNTVTTRQAQVKELEEEKKKASSSEQLSYTLQIQSLEIEIKETGYNITAQEKTIKQAEETLKDGTVTSPADGTIKSINSDSSEGSSTEGFIVITRAGEFRIRGTVNEQNRAMLFEGMTVIIRSRAEDRCWNGTITLIDTENPIQNNNYGYGAVYDTGVGSSDSNATTSSNYPFYIELESAEDLMIGQHVYIEPDIGQNSDEGFALPAYFIADATDDPYVWVANEDDELEKREITLGSYDTAADTYQVLEGLELTDYIADPSEPCQKGAPVNRYDEGSFGGDEPIADELPTVGDSVDTIDSVT